MGRGALGAAPWARAAPSGVAPEGSLSASTRRARRRRRNMFVHGGMVCDGRSFSKRLREERFKLLHVDIKFHQHDGTCTTCLTCLQKNLMSMEVEMGGGMDGCGAEGKGGAAGGREEGGVLWQRDRDGCRRPPARRFPAIGWAIGSDAPSLGDEALRCAFPPTLVTRHGRRHHLGPGRIGPSLRTGGGRSPPSGRMP